MTDPQSPPTGKTDTPAGAPNWGPWLFYATLVVVLLFFWWLLIDSGGVSGHHG